MTRFQPTKITGLSNDTFNNVERFIGGEHFAKEVSQSIIRNFDFEERDVIPDTVTEAVQGKPKKDITYYEHLVKVVKNNLTLNPPIHLKDDVLYLQTEQELSKILKAVTVRFINICHRQRYIIVLNDEIVFLPEHYKNHDKEELGRYVKLALLEYQDQSKIKLVKQIKTDARLFASHMLKTVVTA